ncbi:acyltransferase [Vibrio chaetopteri]|uniref:acyltransferase n=1 Tax=Vibrio chaetopteri TaxID=3016528 RepID=UPI003AB4DAFF
MFFYRIKQVYWYARFMLLSLLYKKVGAFSYIAPALSIIGYSKISLGTKVRIAKNSRIECADKESNLVFRNNVSVGPHFTVIACSHLEIGCDTTISQNVFICDVEHEYRHIGVHVMDQPLVKSKTLIGKGCFIGYGTIIQAGTELGEQCIVGANSVVRGSFPNRCVIAGNPAKVIKKYDSKTQCWNRV